MLLEKVGKIEAHAPIHTEFFGDLVSLFLVNVCFVARNTRKTAVGDGQHTHISYSFIKVVMLTFSVVYIHNSP